MSTYSDDAGAMTGILAALHDPDLIEDLASTEHDRWAHWQRYLHEQCVQQPDGSLLIPAELVDRWTKQINTPYSQLSANEQASDREQVETYLEVLKRRFMKGADPEGAPSD